MSNDVKVPRLLTAKQVAEMLTVPVYTIYEMAKAGEGPPHLRIRTQYRFPEDGVVQWIHDETKRSRLFRAAGEVRGVLET